MLRLAGRLSHCLAVIDKALTAVTIVRLVAAVGVTFVKRKFFPS